MVEVKDKADFESACKTDSEWGYGACMVSIQVRDVPEDVHAELARLAERSGMSLNRFLLEELRRIAGRGRNAAILRRVDAVPGKRPTTEQIVAAIRATRDAAG